MSSIKYIGTLGCSGLEGDSVNWVSRAKKVGWCDRMWAV